MSGSSGPRTDDVDTPDGAREVLREEARNVVAEQLQTLRDTDRKALATARINGLVLGVLASASSLSRNPGDVVNDWIVGGAGLLLLSLCVSVFTYTVDRPNYGIGPGYFDAVLVDLDSETETVDDLLARYANWIEGNSAEISTNGTYLLLSQVAFVAGLAAIAYGVYRAL